MARKSGFVRRHGSMIRETRWLDGPHLRTSVAAGGVSIIFSLTAVELALRPFTVIRTRGIWSLRSDQLAAGEPQAAALGWCVVSEQSLAIGITAVPTPVTDMSSDLWFGYQFLLNEFIFVSATGIDATGSVSQEYDSKGARKVEDGQDVIAVLEVPSSASSEGSTIMTQSRTLIKLH